MGAFRRSLTANLSPLLLRVALGVTFLWAGYPKIFEKDAFPPEAAAQLANMGVKRAQDAAIGASATPPARKDAAPTPGDALPDPSTSVVTHPRITLAQSAPAVARTYTAADFAHPVELSRLHGVALALNGSASRDKPIWPKSLGGEPWAIRFAYAVAWTELLAGLFVLIGLFTPLSAFAIACVMGTAMWLTQIGPATLGGGPSSLWFLPPHNGFSTGADGWKNFLFQLVLFVSAVSLMFSGAGALSFDRFIFGARHDDGSSRRGRASYNSDDEHDEDEDEE
jgi:uncharacterized membrane protein YphA (DoxX/SURF4 family)